MAPDGAVSVMGGNWQIFDNMVKASGAKVYLNTSVVSISVRSKGTIGNPSTKYLLKAEGSDPDPGSIAAESETEFGPFDDVVLATPFQFSKISDGGAAILHPIDEIPYVQLHVTLFASPFSMSPGFFNLGSGMAVPSVVLTTLAATDSPATGVDAAGKAGFFSISTLRTITNPKTGRDEYVYKIFSPEKVTPEFLTSLLGVEIPSAFTGTVADAGGAENQAVVEPISWYYAHAFDSYPVLYPRVTFQDPILGPNLYYTSGVESFISTMETSALMGMNIARLIVNDILEDERQPGFVKVEKQTILQEQIEETVETKDYREL